MSRIRSRRRSTALVVGAVLGLAGLSGCGAPTQAREVPGAAAWSPSGGPITATPTAPIPQAPATVPAAADVGAAPARVTVPGRGIDVPVDPVGVAADGQMEIPPLAERGGWYRFGADPTDERGTTVIAAHVDSVASGKTGPFLHLVDVTPGDLVEVELVDGTVRSYRVDAVTRFPKSEARWPEVFTRDGSPRLALITCGGAFDRDTRHYVDNVLVTASPQAT